jgi:rod shape determining protein RodA
MNFKSILYNLKIDAKLFYLLMITCLFGLFILYGASESLTLVFKQAIHLIIALFLMIIIGQIPPHILKHYSPYLMIFGVILLLVVLFFGVSVNGAQRWLRIGFFNFQPSELLKVIVPIAIAAILTKEALPPRMDRILISFVAIIIIVILIAKQPDLGTSLLIGASGIFVLFFSGLSWRIILYSFVSLLIISPLLWFFVLLNYQKQRIFTFLNPESDPLGSGYQVIQSKIAIGSGGLMGKGYLQGTQSQLDFLPEHSTDFIFSVLAEEFGFIGIIILFTLYGLIIYRCLIISLATNDNFARLLGASLTLTFFIYIFVNVGMISGLLPVVGVPLPFISYGGTSLVTLMVSFGLIMSVSQNKKLNS